MSKILNLKVATILAITVSLLISISTVGAQTALQPTEDSTVSSCMPDINEGHLEILYVASGYCERWAYLKFDLSGISDATIDDVVLWLFCRYNYSIAPGPIDVDVCEASNAWTEGTITWNNKPAGDPGPVLATTSIDGTGKWYKWESPALTKYVNGSIGGIVSLIVKLPAVSIGTNQIAFFSKENIVSQPLLDINPLDPSKRSTGGFDIPVNKLVMLAPYVALALAVSVGTVATLVSIKRRREN